MHTLFADDVDTSELDLLCGKTALPLETGDGTSDWKALFT